MNLSNALHRSGLCRGVGLTFARVMVALLVHFAVPRVHGQTCVADWLPGEPGKTIGGTVSAFTNFDPDGAGPLPNLLIAGGSGLNVDGYSTQKIMGFNGQNWQPLEGTNGSGSVSALTVFSNQLVVGGSFTSMSGVAASNIARWNGTTWSPMSSGFSGGEVRALAVFNNELYAAGAFATASGLPANRIARWNGSSWVALQGGIAGGVGVVNSLLAFNGFLFVGGNFATAGSVVASNLATWNGSAWASFGNPDNVVNALGSFSGVAINSNRVFIGGSFANIGGIAASRVAVLRFDPINGNTWSALSNTDTFSPACTSLLIRSSGVSSFQVNATFRYSLGFPIGSGSYVSRWNGTTWAELGVSNTTCLGFYNGQILAGGSRTPACLAYDNTNWNELGRGNPGRIDAVANFGTDVVAAVDNAVQKRSSATGLWSRVGGAANGFVDAVLALPNNDIVAAGQFANLESATNNIAQWDGTSWTALGTGITGTGSSGVTALARMPNGDIVAGGLFTSAGGLAALNIARWNGFAWSPLGSGVGGPIYALKVAANGDLYAGGVFNTASGAATNGIARWDGTNWRPLGAGVNGQVRAIEQLADNSIVVAGFFSTAGGLPANSIARWNGTTWSALGSGITESGGGTSVGYALKVLASGELIVAGNFELAGGVSASRIARWNGSTWSELNDGLRDADVGGAGGLGLAVLADNTLAVCGDFDLAGTSVSANFALWSLPTSGCCDSIDFNQNTVFPEEQDVIDFFNVLAGGPCSFGNTCSDIDFNNNEVFPEEQDVIDFFNVLAGGQCT